MQQTKTEAGKGLSGEKLIRAAGFLAALIFSGQLSAQDTTPEVEEIIVSGELTSSRLLFQVDRAQDEVYRLFNELLDNKEYRISCSRRAPTGSYILERECQPAFLSNARARESAQTLGAWRSGEEQEPIRAMKDALSGRSSDQDIRFDLGARYQQMNQKMFDLASENPEFLAALQRFAELRAQHAAMLAEEQRSRRKRR
jgi:hypothetical protein